MLYLAAMPTQSSPSACSLSSDTTKECMVARKKPGTQPQPGQPISLRTLGEYLNLSPATISLVLNNAPGVRSIPQETRDRVTEAAAKFDYRPSFFARSLRKRQTFTVGVLVPSSERQLRDPGAGRAGRVPDRGGIFLPHVPAIGASPT